MSTLALKHAPAVAGCAARACPRCQQRRCRGSGSGRAQPRLLCRALDGDDSEQPQQPLQPQQASQLQEQPREQQEQAQPSSSAAAPATGSGMYSVMAVLASAGALESAYLAAAKLLSDGGVACPTSGCATVLNSAYGSLFGAPLPLFGAAAYGGVALAAGLAAADVAAGRRPPAWLAACLAGGVGVLAATSASLMAILHTALGGAPCVWCYASAGLSAGLLAALLAGLDTRGIAAAAGPGLGGTAAAVAALALGFGPIGSSGAAAELELPYVAPVVTSTSSDAALALAHRLREAGAVMYGAFWCTHCYDQKAEFGAAAMAEFPYVECFPDGWRKGVKIAPACEAANVKAFPTWVIGGTTMEGQLDLRQLEELLDASSAPSEAAAVAAAAAE